MSEEAFSRSNYDFYKRGCTPLLSYRHSSTHARVFIPWQINQMDNLLCFVGNVGIKLSGVGAGFFSIEKKRVRYRDFRNEMIHLTREM